MPGILIFVKWISGLFVAPVDDDANVVQDEKTDK